MVAFILMVYPLPGRIKGCEPIAITTAWCLIIDFYSHTMYFKSFQIHEASSYSLLTVGGSTGIGENFCSAKDTK